MAAYSLDEGSGTIAADSYGDHDGTIEGAEWTEGKYGLALEFGGEEECVSVPDSADLQLREDFTLEAWVKPEGGVQHDPVIFKETEGFASYAIGIGFQYNGKVEGYIGEEGEDYEQVLSPEPVSPGHWSHIALTFDGEAMRLYVNGKLVDTTPTNVGNMPSAGPLSIGCARSFNEYFTGKIDEARIYDRALDAKEVGEDMEKGVQTQPSKDPVAAYALDEGSGAIAADSYGDHDGTIEGPEWTEGKYGLALKFNGDEDCVNVPDSADLQLREDFTLEAWVKPEGGVQHDPVIFKETENFFGYAIGLGFQHSGKVEGYVGEEGEDYEQVLSPEPVSTGQWSHIALSYDGEALRLYVNDKLVDTNPTEVGAGESSGPLQIGCTRDFEEDFDGKIDEVRIYNRALDATEVGEDMGKGIQTQPSQNPVAAYSLDEGSGEVATDSYGDHDGTIEGPEWTEGKYGLALKFNGDEDCVNVPDSADLQLREDFTLEAWVEPEGGLSSDPVIFKETENFFGYAIGLGFQHSGKVEGYVGEEGAGYEQVLSPESVQTGKWSHIALSYDGEALRLYVNDKLVDTNPTEVGAGESSGPLQIGCTRDFEEDFDGKIDEVRIYNRALDAEEVGKDMNSAPLNTIISSGPSGKVLAGEVSFSFTANQLGTTFECSLDEAAFSSCASPKKYEGLVEGTHSFRVRAVNAAKEQDETPAGRSFEVVQPPQTTITSPKPSYTSHEHWPIEFTSSKSGSTFKCKLNISGLNTFQPCKSPYTLLRGLSDTERYTFEVVATDEEGIADPTPASWTFNPDIYPPAPSADKLIYPEAGKKTASYYTLEAEWSKALDGGEVADVTFQMQLPKWEVFKTVPAECVIDGKGKGVSWPLSATSNPGHSEPVFLKVKGCAPFVEAGYPEQEVKFRAVFDGAPSVAGASEPVATEFAREHNASRVSTDATESIGPVSLDLLSGAYTISRTDVSIPVPGSEANLEFTRVYDSTIENNKPGYSFVLGGWWQPSTPVEAEYEGEAWTSVKEVVIPATPAVFERECWNEEGETVSCGASCPPEFCEEWEAEEAQPEERWMELLDNEGGGIPFEISGSSYIAPEYAKELKLTREGSEHIVLSDPNGTHTIFTKSNSQEYLPKEVSFQATPSSVRMVYESVGGFEGLRLKKEIAPAPAGVTCGDSTSIETAGCRTLMFEYLSTNTWAKAKFPASYVNLASIRYYNASGNPSTSQKVAEYNYNGEVDLTEEWDPRLPSLKEKYTFDNNRITSLTPPGEEPWEFGYTCTTLCKLKSVSRASLLKSEPTATTTIAYEVPLSGENAPYDMSAESVAEWGQTDFPVDATAVFPPNQTPGSYPPSDYSGAAIHYMDPDGYEVNTASPSPPGVEGDSITTTETDVHGNVVRELSAQNRLEALEAKDRAARSYELDTHSVYNEDGTRMLESWGPLHQVRLASSGETVEARQHTTVEYDKGWDPFNTERAEGAVAPNLPTKETSAAVVPGQEGELEPRVTETAYKWEFRKPTKEIVDPEGLDLVSRTVYNSSGQVIEERQPSDTEGHTAGTTKTVYYTAGAQPEFVSCGEKPAWAGLPCSIAPAGSAEEAIANDFTNFKTYSSLDEPTEIRETKGGFLMRTTTTTYDSAGRQIKTHATGTGVASVSAVETTYNSKTGAPESQRFLCEGSESECKGFDSQEVRTSYDALGRPIEYKDADGNVSGVAYDLLGRSVAVSDGKGTQEITYDEESGLPTEMTDSAAGTFKAAYNADGQMTQQLLPDGLAQKISYDPEGTAVSLAYEKQTYCSSACTWLAFSREDSIGGQVLREESTLGNHEYSYDKAGRLTLTKEFGLGGSCKTRSYAFDKDSNRTSLTTREPKENGSCNTESGGSKTSYSYDTADRLIGEGVEYDGVGGIISLPAKYSGGGKLTTSYYANELTHSQAQDGITNTYNLDADLRERERIRTGSEHGTEIYHYVASSDTPAWTEEIGEKATTWTRSIPTLGGGLGALEKSNGEVTLQLANMHGDTIASAAIDPEGTKLLDTQQFDEFGNPLQSEFLTGGNAEYGWLGARGRRTQLPSGVIQMGERSYVPALGRFLTVDPIKGGSANAYDYANQDPINNFDLTGQRFCIHKYGREICGNNGKQIQRGAHRARRETRRLSREHHLHTPVVVSRKCTAVACRIGWPGTKTNPGTHSSGLAGVANTIVHLLAKYGTSRALSWANGTNNTQTEGCAKDASEAWTETSELRAAGAADGTVIEAGTLTTSILYAGAACIGGAL